MSKRQAQTGHRSGTVVDPIRPETVSRRCPDEGWRWTGRMAPGPGIVILENAAPGQRKNCRRRKKTSEHPAHPRQQERQPERQHGQSEA